MCNKRFKAKQDERVVRRLVLDSWAGRSETPVEIIGQTPKRFRIRAITRTRLAGRDRWLKAGEVALVPICALRDKRPDPPKEHP